MAIPARITLVTLGTRDFAALRAFYLALGWPLAVDEHEFCVVRTAGTYLALYPRASLLAEVGGIPEASEGFRHFALAINVDSAQAVDEAIATALSCGARLLHAGRAMDWGGYSGYFADPEGNAWEVAHNPFWSIDAEGRARIPEA
jgi:catechol 2,3-dioxygenase-like lactoylglutathione lyase family enzyme